MQNKSNYEVGLTTIEECFNNNTLRDVALDNTAVKFVTSTPWAKLRLKILILEHNERHDQLNQIHAKTFDDAFCVLGDYKKAADKISVEGITTPDNVLKKIISGIIRSAMNKTDSELHDTSIFLTKGVLSTIMVGDNYNELQKLVASYNRNRENCDSISIRDKDELVFHLRVAAAAQKDRSLSYIPVVTRAMAVQSIVACWLAGKKQNSVDYSLLNKLRPT